MMDWIAIVSACAMTGIVGLGFVVWERYEGQRLARERLHRRIPRRRHPWGIRAGRGAA